MTRTARSSRREYKRAGASLRVLDGGLASSDLPDVGPRLGVFRGLASTFEPDTGGVTGLPDQFAPGAFARSLAEHRARNGRPIRLKRQHETLIGAIPLAGVRETDRGLVVEGHVNLDTRAGRDAWSLVEQGALSDLSVGFVTVRSRVVKLGAQSVRRIEEALLFEVSLVDEPANPGAMVLDVLDRDERREGKAQRSAGEEDLARVLADLRDTKDSLVLDRLERLDVRGSAREGGLRKMLEDLESSRRALR